MWHPNSRNFLKSRHVRFLEKLVYKDVYEKGQNEINMEIKETELTHDVEIEFLINEPAKEKENLIEKSKVSNSENLELNKNKYKKEVD